MEEKSIRTSIQKQKGKKQSKVCYKLEEELNTGESSEMCIDNTGTAHLHSQNLSQNDLPGKQMQDRFNLYESHSDSG